MRRREAGRVRRPRALRNKALGRHRGSPRANRSPCQELADVSRRKSFPTLELKRGPLPQTSQVLLLRYRLRCLSAYGAPRGARRDP